MVHGPRTCRPWLSCRRTRNSTGASTDGRGDDHKAAQGNSDQSQCDATPAVLVGAPLGPIRTFANVSKSYENRQMGTPLDCHGNSTWTSGSHPVIECARDNCSRGLNNRGRANIAIFRTLGPAQRWAVVLVSTIPLNAATGYIYDHCTTII